MVNRLILHIVESSSRGRAELARIGYGLGHHCEVYCDIGELALHAPGHGVILARDAEDEGGVVYMLERLTRLGLYLPLIAVDDELQPRRVVEAIQAGALDYLALPLDSEQLAQCLERIAGETEHYSAARRRMADARDRLASLTARERAVLDWLAQGSSKRSIARELAISPRTVELDRASMMAKLGTHHETEALQLRLEAQADNRVA